MRMVQRAAVIQLAAFAGLLGIGVATAEGVTSTPSKQADLTSFSNFTEEQGKGPGAPEKTISFEMRDKPWSGVLEWLSDQSGLPIITNHKPTGTFSFIASQKKTYTIPEIIDILNEALLSQKYLLIRRDQSLTLVPADEKIDPAILPRIRIEDLNRRGNTEMASIVLPLTSLVAEDLQPEIKKMMGPFGEAVAMAKANQLVLQDTVGNLKRIVKTIRDIEENEKGQAESYSHTCQYIKARDAEKIVRELLGDPRELFRLTQPQPSFLQGNPFGGGGGQRQQPQAIATGPAPKIRMHYVSADERTNTVLVTGPADKIAQARDILKRVDVKQTGQQAVVVGPPILKEYSVPVGNADALAKTLQEIYKGSGAIRISAAGTSSILVWAGPDDQIEIATQIRGSRDKNTKTQLLPLSSLEAAKVVETLKGMFGDPKTGAPFIEADTGRNAIVVRGTAEQVAEVDVALQAIGENGGQVGGNVRVITLDKGSAATLAEALERMISQMRKNPVRIVIPGNTRPGAEPSKDKGSGGAEEQEEPPVNGKQLIDPQDKKAATEKPGRQEAPITITAVGNRLIITSDDPQALALAQQLVRLIMQTPGGEGDFEILKLKNASATEAAKVLDEAFNGPKQQANPNPFFGGRFGNVTPPANPAANRIRVVADPGTNSLLVRASPLDMLTIRHLLDKALDSGVTDSKAITKTWIVPLRYASATEVASVIRDVYREHINVNPTNVVVGGFRGFGFGGRGQQNQANLDANGNPRQVTLSVGVDDRTNSLVLACSSAMHEDIKKLASELDSAAKDSNRTIRVMSVKGIDPILVQQAVDAIQGRRTTTQPGMGGTTPMRGGGFQPGSNQGPRNQNSGGRGGQGPPGTSQLSPDPNRGRDFFAERVMDDPREPILFDPQNHLNAKVEDASKADDLSSSAASIQLIQFSQRQATPPSEDIRGPRSPVTAEALEQLGVVVISGNNPADVDEIVKVIEYIQKLGAGAEVQIQFVPLERADATSVANTLNQLFLRVTVGPNSNVAGRQPTTTPVQTSFTGMGGQQTQASQMAASGSVVLIPVPRLNAILLAAPKARVDDIIKEIKRLDQPSVPQGQAQTFYLKKASASRVATLISGFYAQRYPNETSAQQQVRITHDDTNNTVIVQAAPADLAEIKDLIWRMDNTVSAAVNDLRIVPLRNVLPDEMASILLQAIAQGVVPSNPAAVSNIVPTAPTQPGALGALGAQPGGVRPPGQLGTTPTGGVSPTPTTTPGAPGSATKFTSLRFISPRRNGTAVVESGLLEDIHITSDARLNSLIIAAPPKTMDLIMALIQELDVLPALRSEINIFALKKADASAMGQLLQQLFLGTSGTPSGTAGPTGGPGTPGAPGIPGGPGALGAAAAAAGAARTSAPLTVAGTTPEGTPLIELRITVDQRTNSLIVAGSRHELDVIEAVVSRLEDADVQNRNNNVFHLRNSAAADVANAINGFFTSSISVQRLGQQLTAFQEIEREVVVVPEPISNKLIISSAPKYYGEIVRIIQELDAEPPQVVIQALVAEVDLDGSEEFGIELGLQSPVLFSRSVVPANGFLGPTGVVNYASPGLVPTGVTVNNSINPAALPGFNFNSTGPLGNNPVVNPGVVGFQGLGNLGVGRSSPTSGVGGFVFSAASDSFNILIRALKTQGRMDVLSRPQVMTTDNQTAMVLVGQSVPYVSATNITATGLITNSVTYRDVGVQLQVTPRISPDGKVLMRVIPEVSSVATTPISLGNGVTATAFNVQTVQTTVIAEDGETVAIGGLISKTDAKSENKIPFFGDLPYIGALWRYRTQSKHKTEILVILTPHIVRSRYEADHILCEESRRMDWILGDVLKIHGTSGMDPVLPPLKNTAGACLGNPIDIVAPFPASAPPSPDANQGPILPMPRPLSPNNADARQNSGQPGSSALIPPEPTPAFGYPGTAGGQRK